MADETHYEVLGVPVTASEKDIIHAYRVLIRTWHPDIAGPEGAEKTAAINFAYDILRDPAARRDYDRTITPPPAAAQPGTSGRTSPTTKPAQEQERPTARSTKYSRPNVEIRTDIPGRTVRRVTTAIATAVIIAAIAFMSVTEPPNDVSALADPVKFITLIGVITLTCSRKLHAIHAAAVLPVALLLIALGTGPSNEFFTHTLPTSILIAGTVAATAAATAHIMNRMLRADRTRIKDAQSWESMQRFLAVYRDVDLYWVENCIPHGNGHYTLVLQTPHADTTTNQVVTTKPVTPGLWVALTRDGIPLQTAPNQGPVAWDLLARKA